MNILAFDFGGTTVKYSLWHDNELLEVKNFDTPKTWEETTEQLIKIKTEYKKDYKIDGAAFSFPGCVDKSAGDIKGNCAIKYIHNRPIYEQLTEVMGVPVAMENDANSAALAEIWSGVAKDAKNVLFVVVGTGVGGAVIVDGKVHSGNSLFGGEFGIMFMDYDATGKNRTLSGLGTAVVMAERYCDAMGVPHLTYSGREVFEFAKNGDETAQKEVDTFYKYLSLGLFNLQTSFDPEMIVLGGGISANPEIIETLQNKVNDLIVESNMTDLKSNIKPCFYKNDANLIGAVKNFEVVHGNV